MKRQGLVVSAMLTIVRKRVRHVQAMASVLVLVCPAMLCQAAQTGKEIIGTWRFTKVLDLAEMTSIDEEGARQLLGHTMTIGANGTRFDDESCQPPDFETKRVEPNLYLQREAGVDNSKLRLPNPVTVIDISCTTVYLRKSGRAVMFWDGFFFEAVRIRSDRAGTERSTKAPAA